MDGETLDPERAVAVYAAPDAISAEIAVGVLTAEGIPAFIRGQELSSSLANILQTGSGFWGEVCVRAGDRERAREALDAAQSRTPEVSDEELEAAAAQSYDPDV